MDFSGVTAINTYLAGNVATSAALKDGTEYWLVCVYMKLPTNADWLANGGLQSFCQWGGTAFPTGNQFIIIAFSTSGRAIDFRRQTAVSASENLQLTPAVADQGTLVQLACWRNASGFGARIKGVTSTVAPAPVASPSINSADFSGIEPRFGVIANSWGATPNTTRKFRIYRTWIENLRISGRTPATVLDADYSRTIARGVFT
jgi:hypothetical protein